MKTRAAVAWKAGVPLTLETVDLEGPKAEVPNDAAFGGARGRTDAVGVC